MMETTNMSWGTHFYVLGNISIVVSEMQTVQIIFDFASFCGRFH